MLSNIKKTKVVKHDSHLILTEFLSENLQNYRTLWLALFKTGPGVVLSTLNQI